MRADKHVMRMHALVVRVRTSRWVLAASRQTTQLSSMFSSCKGIHRGSAGAGAGGAGRDIHSDCAHAHKHFRACPSHGALHQAAEHAASQHC
eukprot:6191883-Pleurochrysis_carterae.AAC.2